LGRLRTYLLPRNHCIRVLQQKSQEGEEKNIKILFSELRAGHPLAVLVGPKSRIFVSIPYTRWLSQGETP
jgi:hypothetical protein